MSAFSKNCKYCHNQIWLSNHEGAWHAYDQQPNGQYPVDRHNCSSYNTEAYRR